MIRWVVSFVDLDGDLRCFDETYISYVAAMVAIEDWLIEGEEHPELRGVGSETLLIKHDIERPANYRDTRFRLWAIQPVEVT